MALFMFPIWTAARENLQFNNLNFKNYKFKYLLYPPFGSIKYGTIPFGHLFVLEEDARLFVWFILMSPSTSVGSCCSLLKGKLVKPFKNKILINRNKLIFIIFCNLIFFKQEVSPFFLYTYLKTYMKTDNQKYMF